MGTLLVVAAEALRAIAYLEPFDHGTVGIVALRTIDETMVPLAWWLTGIGFLILLIWGRKPVAVPAWITAVAAFLLGWWLILPVQYV
ncbi:MAG: hypothetical protein HONBIEJF_00944 [Fimbriimonadaceae bacterium]|nr:hypothetical protein [Fimbriimonadaceae bacterium]